MPRSVQVHEDDDPESGPIAFIRAARDAGWQARQCAVTGGAVAVLGGRLLHVMCDRYGLTFAPAPLPPGLDPLHVPQCSFPKRAPPGISRAEARRINGEVSPLRAPALEFLRAHPAAGSLELAHHLMVTRQSAAALIRHINRPRKRKA